MSCPWRIVTRRVLHIVRSEDGVCMQVHLQRQMDIGTGVLHLNPENHPESICYESVCRSAVCTLAYEQ